jgi:hypothetical protein
MLAYDGFVAGDSNAEGEYIPNSGSYNFAPGQNPSLVGFTGDWTQINSGQFELGAVPIASLSYPGVGTSGNAAFRKGLVGGSSRSLHPSLNLGADGTTTYFSFLMKLDDATAGGRLEFTETLGTTFGGGVRIRTDGSSFISSAGFQNRTLAATDTDTHLFVFRVDFGEDDNWSVWMDPTDLGVEANSAPDFMGTVISPSSIDITAITLLRENSGGTEGNAFTVDEIRVADSWGTDLFGEPVPEPSTVTLLIVIGGVLLSRKHK